MALKVMKSGVTSRSAVRVIRRLVELYAGSGRDERAAEYRALLSVEATAS